ncbi:methyl-accepting chemotaxis protein [Halothermothrix orenii]|uniref:Methyl-accepting chemotaxis sensory transducer n=1 Tax=Halothermothrix orenii (strain H 168 / OCM 544 / DSM 9562) TaxID=373903 RepID=B8D1I6_HALOH|nr:methyl-accepting chemotaxis protein [Halothermothrix orenii]ACL69063.1 methyl-accepting chemotaxis sensory transducer [Halothermothrix orenii H 168]
MKLKVTMSAFIKKGGKAISNFFLKIEKGLINLLNKFKIGKRLMFFILLLIILVIGLNSYLSLNTFTGYVTNQQKQNMLEGLYSIDQLLENKRTELSGYARLLSQVPAVKELVTGEGRVDVLFDLRTNLDIVNLAIRDSEFSLVHSFMAEDPLGNKKELTSKLEQLLFQGITVPFISRTESNIYINSIGPITGEFGIETIGSLIISDPINTTLLDQISKNTGYIVQLYAGDELLFNNSDASEFSSIDLVDEDIITSLNKSEESGEEFYITNKNLESGSYLVGYYPIKNFFGDNIGYLTLVSSQQGVTRLVENTQKRTVLYAVIFIIASFLIVLLITRSITVPLKKVIEVTNSVADGDLTRMVKNKSRDQLAEMTKNFNKMVQNLRSIVKELINSSENVYNMSQNLSANTEEVTAASQEVAAASEEIAAGTEEQAEKTEKATRILSEIKTKAQNVASSSEEVFQTVEQAFDRSSYGLEVMGNVSENMDQILEEVQNTQSEVLTLADKIKKINTIVEAINYINEETSLLSLNAAIEAARAGEAGRGFAVVADEIRKLAEESNKSVQEINHIFEQINTATGNVVDSMEKSSKLVEEGEKSVENAEEVFGQIQEAINKSKKVAREINRYVQEQLEGTREISDAVEEINKISRSNAEGAKQSARTNEEQTEVIEQMAQAADELAHMADNLQRMVNQFRI